MAQKDEIQYVRYYAYGSAATKLEEPERRRRERPAPKPKAERIPIPFDPVAVFGTAVAVLLILCVIVGFVQVTRINSQITDTETYMSSLKAEHYALERIYENGYDLDEIKTAAEAMGLVPIEQVKHVTVTIPEPEVVEELPWWEEMWNDFVSMFE